jgi:hypothetical protein
MAMARGLASVEEDNGGLALLVRFNYGVLPSLERERLYQLVDTIAGADVVLHGSTRYIHFYDPTGKEVAWASPIKGIKLVE